MAVDFALVIKYPFHFIIFVFVLWKMDLIGVQQIVKRSRAETKLITKRSTSYFHRGGLAQ